MDVVAALCRRGEEEEQPLMKCRLSDMASAGKQQAAGSTLVDGLGVAADEVEHGAGHVRRRDTQQAELQLARHTAKPDTGDDASAVVRSHPAHMDTSLVVLRQPGRHTHPSNNQEEPLSKMLP